MAVRSTGQTRVRVEGGFHAGLDVVYTAPGEVVAFCDWLEVFRYRRVRVERDRDGVETHVYVPV